MINEISKLEFQIFKFGQFEIRIRSSVGNMRIPHPRTIASITYQKSLKTPMKKGLPQHFQTDLLTLFIPKKEA